MRELSGETQLVTGSRNVWCADNSKKQGAALCIICQAHGAAPFTPGESGALSAPGKQGSAVNTPAGTCVLLSVWTGKITHSEACDRALCFNFRKDLGCSRALWQVPPSCTGRRESTGPAQAPASQGRASKFGFRIKEPRINLVFMLKGRYLLQT